MIVESVRISEPARQQLIRLKAKTGITQWNVLCRWALARSLAEPSAPPVEHREGPPAIEIAWKVFAGTLADLLEAAVRMRLAQQRSCLPAVSEQEFFHLHLHRGISYLAASIQRSPADLLVLANQENQTMSLTATVGIEVHPAHQFDGV